MDRLHELALEAARRTLEEGEDQPPDRVEWARELIKLSAPAGVSESVSISSSAISKESSAPPAR